MNETVRAAKTEAEQALAAAYAAAKGTLPGDGKIRALRDAAIERFDSEGLPHRRIEEWKYTDLRALMPRAMPLAVPPGAAARGRAGDVSRLLPGIEARNLVFVDGTFAPDHSDLRNLESGLTIRAMAEALASGDPLIASHLDKIVPASDATLALNTALMADGILIHLAPGCTIGRPLHLVFTGTGTKPLSVFTRSLAVVENGARGMLVESHECANAYQVNAVLELAVGNEAHFDHIKVFGGSDDVLYISSLMASLGAHARYNDFTFISGGALVRNQIFTRFDGEGALAGIRGASLLKRKQHADNTLLIDHKAGGCQSRELFKTVLDDASRGVFQGKIIVRPDAQKTDARMMTQALLLSETAEADNKPELEIFADDVQCGHGATTGALDDDLKFYLMARGIPAKEAEALLIQAFVGEAIEGIEHAGLRDILMSQIAFWLAARR
jgi:Fe-S cluster assembly protein SufD